MEKLAARRQLVVGSGCLDLVSQEEAQNLLIPALSSSECVARELAVSGLQYVLLRSLDSAALLALAVPLTRLLTDWQLQQGTPRLLLYTLAAGNLHALLMAETAVSVAGVAPGLSLHLRKSHSALH